MTRPSSAQGFLNVIVLVGVFALAMGAAGLTMILNDAGNRHTAENLVSPLNEDYEEVTDQDIDRLRNNLHDNLNYGQLGAALAAPAGPSGSNTATVVVNAVRDGTLSYAIPAVVDQMTNPSSSANTCTDLPPPEEGTQPTGGVVPPAPMGSATYDPSIPLPNRTCCFYLCSDGSNNACTPQPPPTANCTDAAGSGCGARGASIVRSGTAECTVCNTMRCFEGWRRSPSSQ
jgi:hypothetical protein